MTYLQGDDDEETQHGFEIGRKIENWAKHILSMKAKMGTSGNG
jgi:hypothetical protein